MSGLMSLLFSLVPEAAKLLEGKVKKVDQNVLSIIIIRQLTETNDKLDTLLELEGKNGRAVEMLADLVKVSSGKLDLLLERK